MKKIPMIALMVAPYAVLIACYQLTLDITFGVCVYAALLLFNLFYAFQMPKLGFQGKQMLFWNMLMKLCNIPLVNLIRVFTLVMVLIGAIICYIMYRRDGQFSESDDPMMD